VQKLTHVPLAIAILLVISDMRILYYSETFVLGGYYSCVQCPHRMKIQLKLRRHSARTERYRRDPAQ